MTLNPAVDICLEVDRLAGEGKNRARVRSVRAGGGGINVARCIRRLGGAVMAMYVSGGRLDHLLETEALDRLRIPVEGETREALVVAETRTERSYHIVPPGARMTDPEVARCLATIRAEASTYRAIVVTGSFPPGVRDDFAATVVREAQAAATPVLVDITGRHLRRLRGEDAFLIRLDRIEAAGLIGHTIASFTDARQANRHLLETGATRHAVTTVGGLGAVFSDAEADHEISAPPLPRPPRSDACAGDSLVAALTYRITRGDSCLAACEFGVAVAAATVLLPGTDVFEPETADALVRQVRTRRVPRRRPSRARVDMPPGPDTFEARSPLHPHRAAEPKDPSMVSAPRTHNPPMDGLGKEPS
ncbi:1-phosphofructokinase family hexose kinase [Nocardia brevicatena]|uniref:1-phosphofructokinase family hexose kinase n=1 Tax=Nocardia brevicatena TaxID=37327 RepID=UPI000314FA1B|nr:PfkB family carbohydrate kinase [Nocardia brevicatena]